MCHSAVCVSYAVHFFFKTEILTRSESPETLRLKRAFICALQQRLLGCKRQRPRREGGEAREGEGGRKIERKQGGREGGREGGMEGGREGGMEGGRKAVEKKIEAGKIIENE